MELSENNNIKFYISTNNICFFKDYYDIIKIFKSDISLSFYDSNADIIINEYIISENYNYKVKYKCKLNDEIYKYEISDVILENDELLFKRKYKKLFKTALYFLLKGIYGKKSPWGSLTGVRPTALIYNNSINISTLDSYLYSMATDYDIDRDKIKLLKDIFISQSGIITNDNSFVDIYIGIPFCTSRCFYCTFPSNKKDRAKEELYVSCLIKEILAISRIINEKNYTLRAIYIGGGTPTALDEDLFKKLLNIIYDTFPNVLEYTVEAGRPDTINYSKLYLMKKYLVNRISINPQSMNDKTLKLIGRTHSVDKCREIFDLARANGFDNINMDIILGLPGEDINDVQFTLDEIEKMSPDSLTVHTLALKKKSYLTNNLLNKEINEDEIAKMIKIAKDKAYKMFMKPYYMYRLKNMCGSHENTAYAKRGKQCLYNIDMMEETLSILSAGAGSITKKVTNNNNRKINRQANVVNIDEYINRIDEMIDSKLKIFSS